MQPIGALVGIGLEAESKWNLNLPKKVQHDYKKITTIQLPNWYL